MYIYISKKINGRIYLGRYKGEHLIQLIDYLKKKEQFLLLYKKINTTFFNVLLSNKISYKELAFFCKQFHVMLQSGIPLLEALHLLSYQCSSKVLKHNTELILHNINRGENLSKSLEMCTYRYPKFLISMVEIGEESGCLDDIFNQLALYYEKQNKLSKKIQSLTLYPMIVFIFVSVITIFILAFVIPSFHDMIFSMEGEIKGLTFLVFKASGLVKGNFELSVVMFLLIVMLMISIYSRIPYGFSHSLSLRKIPLFNVMYIKKIQCNFTSSMSIMLRSGLDLITSFEMAGELMGDKYIKPKLLEASYSVSTGKAFWESLDTTKLFDPLCLSMIRIGEESGTLDNMLQKLNDILEHEVETITENVSQLIQPVLIIFLSIIVGLIIISVLLPMFSIMDRVPA
jgi:type IV pilus assembly protein PilC